MTTAGKAERVDQVLRAVADRRRRHVLRVLIDRRDEGAALDELAETVASRGLGPSNPETVAPGLHHDHLPKLEDAGLAEYDQRSRWVRYRPDESVEELLQFVENEL